MSGRVPGASRLWLDASAGALIGFFATMIAILVTEAPAFAGATQTTQAAVPILGIIFIVAVTGARLVRSYIGAIVIAFSASLVTVIVEFVLFMLHRAIITMVWPMFLIYFFAYVLTAFGVVMIGAKATAR